jgi:hypothetical protein
MTDSLNQPDPADADLGEPEATSTDTALAPTDALPPAPLPRKGRRGRSIRAEDATPEEAERWLSATINKGWLSATVLGHLVDVTTGDEAIASDASFDLMHALFDDVKPQGQVERLLVEQLAMLHGQILRSHVLSRSQRIDNREKALNAVSRLSGDFRKTLGALRSLRSPVTPTVYATQANIAGQQVVINGDVTPNEVGAHDAP